MNPLDIRTVLLSFSISALICAGVVTSLWLQNRRRFAGLDYWIADFVLQFLALVLLALRGMVPDILSMTLSNTMIIGGTMLVCTGLEQFTGKPNRPLRHLLLLALFIPAHAWFVYIHESLLARNLLFSVALALVCAQCAWLLLRRSGPGLLPGTRLAGSVFAAFLAVSLARIVIDLAVPPGEDFLRSGLYDTLILMMYQMLYIALTFALFLMVNRRLVQELEDDIAARRQAEEALRLSEEKFFKAFHSSPDAILISRLHDGKLIEVNEGFCRMTGYTREEALASSSFALGLWANPQDRERLVEALQTNQRVAELGFDFRTKSGKILNGLYTGELIRLGGEIHMLSTVRDITDRNLAEKILKVRLHLWEYAGTHSIDELTRKALDEVCGLTASPIGFYHLVHEDQNTLTLQGWSTRTEAEFCTAEGRGLHYPISEAGVWVDCVRERRAVIHNDYASLPHRKGLPDGHAAVVRELVAPILRAERVVAILGVGNKASEYDAADTELVEYIADLVWEIVERKRADERIHELNLRLESLAMTDDLTGLANRRSFFLRGEEQIKRARRYQRPLSLLMLDLDRFKLVNDTRGHQAGDRALQCVARTLLGNIREVDLLARLGGEEFGILLENTAGEAAVRLGERLRTAVAEVVCAGEDPGPGITVSIGVSALGEKTEDLDAMLSAADQAMYRAKELGRNRVVYRG